MHSVHIHFSLSILVCLCTCRTQMHDSTGKMQKNEMNCTIFHAEAHGERYYLLFCLAQREKEMNGEITTFSGVVHSISTVRRDFYCVPFLQNTLCNVCIGRINYFTENSTHCNYKNR